MQITQVTFVAKNPKCLSIKPRRYLIDTLDTDEALRAAKKLLMKEKYYYRYRALPPLLIEIHSV